MTERSCIVYRGFYWNPLFYFRFKNLDRALIFISLGGKIPHIFGAFQNPDLTYSTLLLSENLIPRMS